MFNILILDAAISLSNITEDEYFIVAIAVIALVVGFIFKMRKINAKRNKEQENSEQQNDKEQ